jgi:hypothetical protein
MPLPSRDISRPAERFDPKMTAMPDLAIVEPDPAEQAERYGADMPVPGGASGSSVPGAAIAMSASWGPGPSVKTGPSNLISQPTALDPQRTLGGAGSRAGPSLIAAIA